MDQEKRKRQEEEDNRNAIVKVIRMLLQGCSMEAITKETGLTEDQIELLQRKPEQGN